MTLFARSDVVGVGVPADGGGCGRFHGRPVVNGAPHPLFAISCTPCEQYLRKHMADQWSSSRWDIPLTPDEARMATELEKQAQRMQQDESNVRAAELARALVGRDNEANAIPDSDVSPWGTETAAQAVGQGRRAAPDTPAWMDTPAPTGPTSEELAYQDANMDLTTLTLAQLRIKCREQGLAQSGSKKVLIGRLNKQRPAPAPQDD